MARACQKAFGAQGYHAEIDLLYDRSAPQEGAALAVFAETDSDAILGADMAGRPKRRSEDIGRLVARMLMEDLASGSSVDRFLADQLIVFTALAHGKSRFRIPKITEHVETNLWLVRTILGVRAKLEDLWVEVEGIGYEPSASPSVKE